MEKASNPGTDKVTKRNELLFTLFITFVIKVLLINCWRGHLKVTVDLKVKLNCELFCLLSGKGKKFKNDMSIEMLNQETVLNVF